MRAIALAEDEDRKRREVCACARELQMPLVVNQCAPDLSGGTGRRAQAQGVGRKTIRIGQRGRTRKTGWLIGWESALVFSPD